MLIQEFIGKPMAMRPQALAPFLHELSVARNVSRSRDNERDDDNNDDQEIMSAGIARINVHDVLSKRSGWFGSSYQDIESRLQAAMADPRIKGVLLDVDSPGGETAGLFDLSDYLHSCRASKPVYAVCEGAFSAACCLATAATRTYISQTGGMGSIGCACCHLDKSGADEMAGLRYTYIYSLSRKVDGNPHSPLSDSARSSLQAEMTRQTHLLVESVARNRGVSKQKVMDTQSGCYFGSATLGLFADQSGNEDDAVSDMLDLLGIPSRSLRFNSLERAGRKLKMLSAGPKSEAQYEREQLEDARKRLAAL